MKADIVRKKVYLHGSFTNRNFGDELLAAIQVNRISKRGHRVCARTKCSEFERHYESSAFKNGSIRDLIKSDVVVFGGGGYLGEPNSNRLLWGIRFYQNHALVMFLAILLKKEIIVFAVGAGPITQYSIRVLISYLLRASSLIVVRDLESKQYLEQLNGKRLDKPISVGCDLALSQWDLKQLFVREILNARIEDKKYIIIHSGLVIDRDEYIQLDFYKLIKDLSNAGFRFVILGDSKKTNSANNDELIDLLTNADADYEELEYNNYSETLEILSNANAVITHKLHLGIVAINLKKPVLSIPVHQKTKRLYKQLGLQRFCTEYTPLNLLCDNFLESIANKNRQDFRRDVTKVIDGMWKKFFEVLES